MNLDLATHMILTLYFHSMYISDDTEDLKLHSLDEVDSPKRQKQTMQMGLSQTSMQQMYIQPL